MTNLSLPTTAPSGPSPLLSACLCAQLARYDHACSPVLNDLKEAKTIDAVPHFCVTFAVMSAPVVYATTGFILGVTSHLQVFKAGEWERYTPTVAAAYAGTAALSPLVPLCIAGAKHTHLHVYEALLFAAAFWISYFLGLFGSVVRYRVWSHRLKSFPGPVWAKITGFWSISASVPSFQFHRRVQELHREYGDFVRIRR